MAEQDLRDQLALLTLTRDSRHNLVEVQIPCERAILLVLLPPGIVSLPGQAGRRCRPEQQTGVGMPAFRSRHGMSSSCVPVASRSAGAISH
jgi:hypothetical protein